MRVEIAPDGTALKVNRHGRLHGNVKCADCLQPGGCKYYPKEGAWGSHEVAATRCELCAYIRAQIVYLESDPKRKANKSLAAYRAALKAIHNKAKRIGSRGPFVQRSKTDRRTL